MPDPVHDVATPDLVEQLQEVRPVWQLQGHELCADVHVALAVAEVVLMSRRRRTAEMAEPNPGVGLLRELRALGVQEAAPQTIAMVALVEIAVDRLAEFGTMSEEDAWEQLRKDVLGRHCQAPNA
jgi:hypothetical protein